jgi:hypothetical protein
MAQGMQGVCLGYLKNTVFETRRKVRLFRKNLKKGAILRARQNDALRRLPLTAFSSRPASENVDASLK